MKLALLALLASAAFAQTAFTPIRVRAGGAAVTDSLGQTWAADNGFTSGTGWVSTNPIAGVANADQALYQGERDCSPACILDWTTAIPNGNYLIDLKFAELYGPTQVGQRVFSIEINGALVEPDFDVLKFAGATFTALDRVYAVSVTTGTLDIRFLPVTGDPKVDAIQITAGAQPPPAAVIGNTELTYLQQQLAALGQQVAALEQLLATFQACVASPAVIPVTPPAQ